MIRTWKRNVGWLVLAAAGLVVTGCSLGQAPQAAPQKGAYQVVNVTAQNWSWTMSTTNLKYGEDVKFVVKSVQGTHGFSIPGTSISDVVAQGAAPVVVYWHPPAKGNYQIRCDVYCGAGHNNMKTSFSVE